MAPIKFEDDFREKLEQRSIKPSSGAWEKLSHRLEAEEKPAQKISYWWIGLAASIIGVAFFAFQYFVSNPQENDTIPNVIVDAPEIIEQEAQQLKPNQEASEVTIAEEHKVEKSNLEPSKSKLEPIIPYKQSVAVIDHVNEEKEKAFIKKPENISIETAKAEAVAKAIYELDKANNGVSNQTIDSLLKAAQREILLDKMKNEDPIAINAALLLQEVEYELDESFREKVFKTLKKSYGTVKSALAQRND